jgi:hypothetical protein
MLKNVPYLGWHEATDLIGFSYEGCFVLGLEEGFKKTLDYWLEVVHELLGRVFVILIVGYVFQE